MNLLSLAWKNLLSKPLSTLMSLLLLTLGSGMISLLLVFGRQLEDKFTKGIDGIDMVVGAKGSPLQLILSSVYHIDYPNGNIAKAEAEKIMRHPLVAWSIPLAYGDNYKGYKILGTTPKYIDFNKGKLAGGKLWSGPMQAVIGADMAQITGLKVGDNFFGAHGLDANSTDIHEDSKYEVVGVLAHSGTVLDQLILTDISSVWHIHEGHEGKEQPNLAPDLQTQPETKANEELTAVLLHFRGPMGIVMLPRIINENTNMQAAVPAFEINRLISLMGIGVDSIRLLGLVLMLVAAISVFISLYNSLRERRYELALMRVMGASRLRLVLLIQLEGVLLALAGYVVGFGASRAGMWALSRYASENYHYRFDILDLTANDLYLFLLTLLLGSIAALLPALRAYRTDISQTLGDK